MKNAGKSSDENNVELDKLFNFRPVFFSAVFLCLGILFGYLYFLKGVSAWWSMLLLPFAVAPFCFCHSLQRMKKTAFAVAVLAVCFAIGVFSMIARLRDFADTTSYDGKLPVVGRVVEKKDYGETTKFVLDDVYIDGTAEKGKLVAYLPTSLCENVTLSDEVLIEGRVQTDTEYFNTYGFRANEIGEGVRFVMNGTSCAVSGHSLDLFLAVYTRLENRLYAGMDETPAAVTLAVLAGDTSGIEQDLLDNMRMGGIAHIFAVSGLHIGALYAFCLVLLAKTPLRKFPKPVRFALLSALLVFYSGVCGFTPSVIRATVLCLISYGVRLLGLHTDMLETLGVAGIFLLLISPTSLFEVGFQLTFLACLGIALLNRPVLTAFDRAFGLIRKLFPRKLTEEQRVMLDQGDTLPLTLGERVFRGVTSVLSVSIAAQIATAPILLYAFDFLSGWSLLLNFLFVPLISVGFSALLVCAALACLLPASVAWVVLYLPNLGWSGLLLLFETSDFSKFALTGIKLTAGSMICYYAGCTFLSDKWNLSASMRKIYALLCFTAFFAVVWIING